MGRSWARSARRPAGRPSPSAEGWSLAVAWARESYDGLLAVGYTGEQAADILGVALGLWRAAEAVQAGQERDTETPASD
jgi:hypothetical protein